MVDLKNNKNRAILCKETELSPTIGCATRWASAANMMNKYAKIEKEIAKACADLDADIMMPPTSYSFNKALSIDDVSRGSISSLKSYYFC